MGRLFNRGHREEERFVHWLRGIGFEVEEVDSASGQQFRISDVNSHFGGSCDGKVRFSAAYPHMPQMLCEFKTASGKMFDKIKKEGCIRAKPEHFAQMSSYGKRMDLNYALYVVGNKDNDELYFEILELDFGYADKLTQKAANIINAATPPTRISENSASFACKFCDFAAICHGQTPYEKNCRSCAHSSPVESGEWFCSVFSGVIPRDFVPKGCDSYTEVR